jgi:hypothetical protein
MSQQSSTPTPSFAHHKLDAYRVAREALVVGETIARELPRGHATLADQLRRALLSAFLGERGLGAACDLRSNPTRCGSAAHIIRGDGERVQGWERASLLSARRPGVRFRATVTRTAALLRSNHKVARLDRVLPTHARQRLGLLRRARHAPRRPVEGADVAGVERRLAGGSSLDRARAHGPG